VIGISQEAEEAVDTASLAVDPIHERHGEAIGGVFPAPGVTALEYVLQNDVYASAAHLAMEEKCVEQRHAGRAPEAAQVVSVAKMAEFVTEDEGQGNFVVKRV